MLEKLIEAGLRVDAIVLDGKIHRCPVVKKTKNLDGWYAAIQINDKIYGTYGRWDTGLKCKYRDEHIIYDQDAIDAIKAYVERMKQARERDAEVAAGIANEMLSKSKKTDDHPYLKKKGIAIKMPVLDGILLIPMQLNGKIVNVQRIWPDGTKKFLYKGTTKSCAYIFPSKNQNTICICEGFATGYSIHSATGFSVICALTAHNLINIAKIAIEKYPQSKFIVCADNDASNTGEIKAKEAAEICGGIVKMPAEVGTDFNDLLKEQIIEIISDIKKIEDENLTFDIPEDILNIAGAISDGLEAAELSGAPNIIQYNFPVVLSMICRALAGKFEAPNMIWPTQYSIKVGPTSSGKTDIDRIMARFIRETDMEDFYGATDFSSGPGLLRALSIQSQTLIQLDEVTYLFRRFGDNDTIGSGKIAVLLELYTQAGHELKRIYGDSKNNIYIKNPCLILTGNATPTVFDDLRIEDMTSGMLQRFDFFCYDGDAKYRTQINTKITNPMRRFITKLRDLYHAETPKIKQGDLSGLNGVNVIEMDKDTAEVARQWSNEVIDGQNKCEKGDEFSRGIISRQYDASFKFAMVHMASVREIHRMKDPMNMDDLDYGIRLSKLLANWKITVLSKKISSGKFDQNCKLFVEAIKAAIKANMKPTHKVLANRRRQLKELKPNEWSDIVYSLRAKGKIEEYYDGQNKPYYTLV